MSERFRNYLLGYLILYIVFVSFLGVGLFLGKELFIEEKYSFAGFGDLLSEVGKKKSELKSDLWSMTLGKRRADGVVDEVKETVRISKEPLVLAVRTEEQELSKDLSDDDDEESYARYVNLSAVSYDPGRVTVTWVLKGGEAPRGFKLWRSGSSGTGTDTKYTPSSDARSYTWVLNSGEMYSFQVGVVDENGKIATYSNEVEIMTK